MRKCLAIVVLTMSSTLTIFLGLTYAGLMNALFAEHGGDRAAGVFLVGAPFVLCCCYQAWKCLDDRIARPTKMLVMTPMVTFVLSFTAGATVWPFCMGAWFIFFAWQCAKQWRLHGTWHALFVRRSVLG